METSTRWSLILRARGSGPEARVALDALIRRYENTVLTLIRHRGHPPDQTPEDLKQEFFARILQRNDLTRLDQTRGHFRGWLKTAVRRFIINAWDRWHTEKAGCTVTEPLVGESHDNDTPEQLYFAAFSWDTLLHALWRLREGEPNQARFDALKRFLPGPEIDLVEQLPLATSLGMTRTQLAAAICRLRLRLREHLRAVIAETLDLDPASPDAETEIAREMALIYRALHENPTPSWS